MSEAPAEEYPDVEMLSEVIMAVTLTDRGAIGCAYYVARNETLYFMEDVQMGDANMVDSCKSSKDDSLSRTPLTTHSEAVHRSYRRARLHQM
jgi:DNA mismatch repair protein MSH5